MKDKIIEILKVNVFAYQLKDDDDPIQISGFAKATDEIEILIKQNLRDELIKHEVWNMGGNLIEDVNELATLLVDEYLKQQK